MIRLHDSLIIRQKWQILARRIFIAWMLGREAGRGREARCAVLEKFEILSKTEIRLPKPRVCSRSGQSAWGINELDLGLYRMIYRDLRWTRTSTDELVMRNT
jgi:hypothetical protein